MLCIPLRAYPVGLGRFFSGFDAAFSLFEAGFLQILPLLSLEIFLSSGSRFFFFYRCFISFILVTLVNVGLIFPSSATFQIPLREQLRCFSLPFFVTEAARLFFYFFDFGSLRERRSVVLY